MINRPFSTVLARLGLVAAILATLMILAPVASAADPLEYDYEENGEDAVETFSASDEDADAGDIEWSLEGVDKDIFTIDGGELAFKKSPNFEDAKDANEDPDSSIAKGAGDNVYKVTVVASGAKQAVEVTVTDIEEDGEVEFDQPQPQATRDLVAKVTDGDGGVTKQKWQWSKSMDKDAADDDWMTITGAATASRNPAASDVGYYLRASVTYTDRRGAGKTASGMTDAPVEARTLANAAPKFPEIDPITVDENVKGDISDPLVATDADNDVLLYFLDPGYDADTTADGVQNDNSLFKLSTSGQLSLIDELNFELPGTGKTANTEADDGIPDGVIVYNVGVMAKDPSSAPGRASVMVYLEDVNESPEFDEDLEGAVTLYIAENDDQPDIVTNDDLTGAVAAYAATDNDGSKDDGAEYTVEGADEEFFNVSNTGLLSSVDTAGDGKKVLTADFEDKSSYSIVIVASTTGANDNDATPPAGGNRGTKHGSLDVTIKVVDREDNGVVMLSAREPQEDRAVLATLDDDDGGETAISWKWFRGGADIPADDPATPANEYQEALAALWALEDDATVDGNRVCDDTQNTTGESATDACVIGGADSALYTPDADGADRGKTIRAVASYKDARSPADVEYAGASSERSVQMSDPANTAPKFPDQDLDTAGDQSETAMRSVAENQDEGEKVGEPITAEDSDKLIYTLGGPDAASFDIGSGLAHDKVSEAQIVTAVELDYESQQMHEVTVTATDPSGATDTITVMIMVTDENDPPTIAAPSAESVSECSGSKPLKCDYMENGEDAVETFSASDEDADAGDIEWSLEGVDKDIFTIDGGELAFKKSPNFEDAKDANEDPDSSIAKGTGDNVYLVTVVASGAKQAVEVTVTDLEEDGEVTFDQPQPQATRDLLAKVTDGDGGVTKQKWQWSKSMDKDAADDDWMTITGAATASRNPAASDVGYYLRASVTYTDRRGAGKTASGMTDAPVEARTLANAAPKFPEIDPITVDENVKGDISDPLVATDADNDVLLYFLDPGYDADTTADGVQNDNSLFKLSTSGQLSLIDELNFELPGTGKTANTEADDGIPDGVIVYNVGVMAKDPSSAPGRASVMVYLEDVNESPEFDEDLEGAVTLYIAENDDQPDIVTNDDLTGAVAAYAATDNDGSKDDGAEYTVEGADEEFFNVSDTGLLSSVTTAGDGKKVLTADFEDKSSYSIVIVASTTGANDNDATPPAGGNRGTKHGSLDVTIKVVDREDNGVVMLSAREPQEDRAVLATLDDDDGGETAISWKWFRGGADIPADDPATPANEYQEALAALWALEDDATVDGNRVCDDTQNTTGESATDACVIGGADSALYTPDADGADRGKTIRAVASYKDARSPADVEYAGASSERSVQMSDPANTAPKFPDQDLDTAGDQSETAMRSVAENQDEGENVGEPITADDRDKLIYTLGGPDAASFDIGSGLTHDKVSEAQIVTAVELDYESQQMHEVTVTATDPSGATDTITVMIMVTDENDPPTIAAGPAVNTEPAFDGETADRMVYENMAMANVGAPVTATDEDDDDLTYSLNGGGGYFEIDEMSGQITTTMSLDYEMAASHTVTVTASDGEETASIDVTITVGNVVECEDAGAVAVDDRTNTGLMADCEALLGSKDTLMGDGATMTLNWAADMPIGQWDGIRGRSGALAGTPERVTWLYLHGTTANADAGRAESKLNGTIPVELGQLDALTRLYLHRNNLTGGIPAELNDLTNLVWLRLYDNDLGGEIPDLSGMTSLERLYIHQNQLTGGVPAGLSDSVTHILVQRNELSGEIPDLSGMSNLVWLGLYDNELSGSIPASLGMLSKLERLYLHGNDLTDVVPTEIGDLGALTNLWLKDNNLMGGLPNSLDNLTNLERVRISGNSFTGCVPAALDTDNDDIADTGLEVCPSGS